jgi:hypothetical protein
MATLLAAGVITLVPDTLGYTVTNENVHADSLIVFTWARNPGPDFWPWWAEPFEGGFVYTGQSYWDCTTDGKMGWVAFSPDAT